MQWRTRTRRTVIPIGTPQETLAKDKMKAFQGVARTRTVPPTL